MYKTKFIKPLRGVPAQERFFHYAVPEPNTGCWIWGGCSDKDGYGFIRINGKNVKAHRFSFELHSRPLRDGEYVCHKCDNTWCVNPDHLFAGNNSANQIDCARKKRRGPRQKLGVDDVIVIKRMMASGTPTREVASLFGVSVDLLHGIKAGVKWAHVDNA